MKKTIQFLSVLLLIMVLAVSCDKDDNTSAPEDLEVQDFIWEGLNLYYLWKDNVPNLDNSKDDNSSSYVDFLSANSPSNLFENLIYDRQNTDKWSWIVDDYIALENSFQGISKSNGVEYGLFYETNSTTDIFGYVRYILPNTDASNKNVERGFIFDAINGTQLTVSNYRSLLGNENYTMNFADYNNGNPVSNGNSVELEKFEYQENPVFITKTLDVDGTKIGYLMYNGFTSSFDKQLNSAFAQLKAEGATKLILDLRYNSGGSVRTATYLASMITGQFKGQLLTKEKWNNDLQEWFEANNPDWLVNKFTDEINRTDQNSNSVLKESINSLNLSSVHIITTKSSASASELIINGLNPYIDVVTVGSKTSGKYTASITVYDSEDFNRESANPNHTWAMQPIVLEVINKLGENDKDGFDPTISNPEDFNNLGKLGDLNEPLLATAISSITNSSKSITVSKSQELKRFSDSKELTRLGNSMYVEKTFPLELQVRN